MTTFNCPACQSENTQSLQMVCEGGTATNAGGAVGLGSNAGLGVALTGSKSQTTLAAKFSPGPKPTKKEAGGCAIIFVLIFGALGISGVSQGNGAGVLFLFIAIALVIYMISANGKIKEQHKVDMEVWEKRTKHLQTDWLCHRCGHTWMPE